MSPLPLPLLPAQCHVCDSPSKNAVLFLRRHWRRRGFFGGFLVSPQEAPKGEKKPTPDLIELPPLLLSASASYCGEADRGGGRGSTGYRLRTFFYLSFYPQISQGIQKAGQDWRREQKRQPKALHKSLAQVPTVPYVLKGNWLFCDSEGERRYFPLIFLYGTVQVGRHSFL